MINPITQCFFAVNPEEKKKHHSPTLLTLSVCPLSQRLQLDMVLNSLQEQSHVASLLGYSLPSDLGAGLLPPTPDRSASSSTSSTEAPDHLHLAEVLLKTLLLSIGFYTVSLQPLSRLT